MYASCIEVRGQLAGLDLTLIFHNVGPEDRRARWPAPSPSERAISLAPGTLISKGIKSDVTSPPNLPSEWLFLSWNCCLCVTAGGGGSPSVGSDTLTLVTKRRMQDS